MFPKELTDFGVCELNESTGEIRIYSAPYNYRLLPTSNAKEAYWTGNCSAIIVKYKDGSMRRWTSLDNYQVL